jgi:hypothetical protein
MDVGPMTMHAFPRKPYDEVASEFIRDEIRQGSFDDLEYRRYVNELVWLEWYTTEGVGPNTPGISAYGMSVHRWKLAAAHPQAYDTVRRDLGASTRAEEEWGWHGEEDPEERRRWARRHHEEWQVVQEGEQRSPETRTELESRGSRSFAPFRFPVLPYDSIQSPFIREEIRLGSFDDLEYRQRVNELAWIEWFTTDWDSGGLFGQTAKNWRLAAKYPQDFDIVRRELGEETRESLELSGEIGCGDIDAMAVARQHKRAWQAVQQEQREGETKSNRIGAEQQAIDVMEEL